MSQFIHQPHDKIFKLSMADLRVAKDFFTAHVPAKILKHLDLKTLKLEKHSFIDEAYKSTEADVIYSVKQGKHTAYFYLLCENQSTIDKFIVFRLQVYKVRLMEEHRRKYPNQPLPLIYPMVIYSGDPLWNAPTDIVDLMAEPKALAREIFFEPYQLIDLQRIPDTEMRKHLWSGIIEFALKYRKVRDMVNFLETLLPWLETLSNNQGTNLAKTVLNYVVDGVEADNEKLFIQKANEYLSAELRGEAMTLAQRFEQKGREEGLLLGMQKGLQKGMKQGIQQGISLGRHEGEAGLLIRQLLRKFGELPTTYRERIETANNENLSIWGECILDANTIDEVFK